MLRDERVGPMNSKLEQQLSAYICALIEQGNTMLSDTGRGIHVEEKPFSRFKTGCLHLSELLGRSGTSWNEAFRLTRSNLRRDVEQMVGGLESVQYALTTGMLVRIENLVAGEVFQDMLEQADYLFEKKYDVAAAVVARGVLEEHLRRWCQFSDFTPASNVINEYNVALHKGPPSKYDKAVMHHVTAMAAVGNEAAHNLKAPKEDVKRMLVDVRRFLAQHPIA